ncbi:16S rRNA (uracil1498-N3)-methyltransferase [Loktanella fryxellensis]|uniref:Ribosomal RNA small subunit methyltransferase E n=1 Tax=Loktanella fryxellensis TaxID=245187 RepID=A0A1H8AF15_9RHOB|nr:16S rRNA (uracil(1498)-N(3))-methyltransferase [Loktanella fryxellensis]SEM69133.1 16S rRNA (uracil1498-N3)-methyltransferase [Loktanella fryxellensis]
MSSDVRLYVDHPLGAGQTVPLDRDRALYLFAVMRLGVGDRLTLINGRDGAWSALVAEASKRGGVLAVDAQTAPQVTPPDLWLMFAPIKKARTDFIVEKAVEMGASRILPVVTDYTNERARQDKLQAHAVEAAEQCGGTFVPPVDPVARLAAVLDGWGTGADTTERRILFCDEGLVGQPADLSGLAPGPWAVLIGPEGGFSPAERARLQAMPQAQAVSLGPRILRADTAAVAALTLWQVALGDWRGGHA